MAEGDDVVESSGRENTLRGGPSEGPVQRHAGDGRRALWREPGVTADTAFVVGPYVHGGVAAPHSRSAPPGSSSAGVGGPGPLVATPRPWEREHAASRPAPTDSSLAGERGRPGVAHTELRSLPGQKAEAHNRRCFRAVPHI